VNITGSKRSDAVRRLEEVLSSGPVVIFETDARGAIVRSEGGGLRALGVAVDPLGAALADLPGAPPRVVDGARAALAGAPQTTIAEVDGLCYELHFVPLRDGRGGVTGVLGLASDITERTLASELLGKLDAIVWTADAETMRFTFVSPRATALTGYPESEWVARPDFFAEILHPDDRDVARDLRLGAVRDGADRHWVHRVITRDGRVRWFATTMHPMQGGGQLRERLGLAHARALLGLMVDVSDHLHAETTLQRSEARLQLVLAQLPAIIWTTDAQLRFTTSVGAGLTRLGLEENALVGHSLRESLGTDDPKHPFLECVRRVIAGGEPERGEATWFGRSYDTYVKALRDGSGALLGALGLSLDVTEQKATQEALMRAEETLRQAQKMEAIGRLAGGVAHDFNNLLSVISCHVDLLAARDAGVSRTPLNEIRGAVGRASDLTRQLLAFSRRQVLLPRVIDPNNTVVSVTSMLARLIGARIELDVRTDPAVGRVKVDSTQLEQVVMNLIVNARDAMPEGGTLAVSTRNEDVTVERRGVPRGAYVVISVADTGVGMDEATRARIFEPFFTTKEVGRGTGLGLSTVLGIVEQSGGRVTVDSAPGRGTKFEIFLPRTEEIEAPPPSLADVGAPPTGARVLLVEDDDSVRSVVASILERTYEVLTAKNADEALRIVETEERTIDVLVSDVVMPGMGGSELAARVRKERPLARVLFMSGFVSRVPTLSRGMAFLQKPFTPDELEKKIRALLTSRR
jgi:PAS domain S-box-containing protein